MAISGINLATHTYRNTPFTPSPSPSPPSPAALSGASVGDTVSISAAARMAYQSTQAPALETYAVPNWIAEYGYKLSPQIGVPAHQSRTAGAELARVPESARKDYGKIVEKLYRQTLQENGIDTLEKHHGMLIADIAQSEAIHQQFRQKIAASPEINALLNAS